jgi:hypothetical protein
VACGSSVPHHRADADASVPAVQLRHLLAVADRSHDRIGHARLFVLLYFLFASSAR